MMAGSLLNLAFLVVQVAACDTDNHVLLFKHSVVDVQQSVNAEESYAKNEVGGRVVSYGRCADGPP